MESRVSRPVDTDIWNHQIGYELNDSHVPSPPSESSGDFDDDQDSSSDSGINEDTAGENDGSIDEDNEESNQ